MAKRRSAFSKDSFTGAKSWSKDSLTEDTALSMAFCVWVLMVFSESLIRSMTQSTVAGELLGWSLLIDRLRYKGAVEESDPAAVSAPKNDHTFEKAFGASSWCGFWRHVLNAVSCGFELSNEIGIHRIIEVFLKAVVKDFHVTDVAVVVLLCLPFRVLADRTAQTVRALVEISRPLRDGDRLRVRH